MNNKIASFNQRVDYAERGMQIGENSRTFDACFELYDGAFVVAALMRRAKHNPQLDHMIRNMFRRFENFEDSHWAKISAKYAAIPTDRLHIAAKQERARAAQENAAFLAKQEGRAVPKQLDLI